MNIRNYISAALLALSTVLTACGGGGDSTQAGINGGGLNGGGSSAPGVAVGGITAFGSIFVNGIEFDISSAAVTVDGVSSTQSGLRKGQVVTVKGTINKSTGKGVATTVDYRNSLRGLVSSVNTVAGTFVVVGQTVTVSGATLFDGIDGLTAIIANTTGVEVSGFVNEFGKIEATLVEATTINTNEWELKGKITTTPINQQFNIDTTVVNYTSAVGTGQVFGVPALDACVEVKGNFTSNVMFATRVEVKSCGLSVTVSPNDVGEIEGVITTGVAGNQFVMGATKVSIAGSPQYVNGNSGGLTAGKQVEVEGTFNSSGVLVASKIEFKLGTDIRMIGRVDSDNLRNPAGTFKMFGVVVTTNANTTFVDKTTSNSTFSLSNISPGDFLEVRGYESPSHTAMTAVTLERRSAGGSPYELRAIASNLTATSVMLFGNVVVMPTGSASLTGIADGDLVRARGPASSAWSAPPNFMADSVQ